jgi:hypothetical protein
MDDYYFFRFMRDLVHADEPDRLAELHGIARTMPMDDEDRQELLLRLEERCRLLGAALPPPRDPGAGSWPELFPSLQPPGVLHLDADPWDADWLRQDLAPELRTLQGLRTRFPGDAELLRFRAWPVYARVRRRYPWLRGLEAGQ